MEEWEQEAAEEAYRRNFRNPDPYALPQWAYAVLFLPGRDQIVSGQSFPVSGQHGGVRYRGWYVMRREDLTTSKQANKQSIKQSIKQASK